MRAMENAITRDSLADLLNEVNAAELARRSGVALKTIYRLRHRKHAAGLDTVQKLLRSIEEMRVPDADPQPAGQGA